MPRVKIFKFPTMAGLVGISAALAGVALWNSPSHAAPSAADPASALVARPITGAASQWLPWARDELQEPKLFQSQRGLLDVLMVAHEAPVAAFAPFRTTGWVYEICHRPADGGNHCPASDTSDNPYGGSRLQVEPGDTLKIHLVNKLPIFTLPNDPDASTNPNSMMNHMGMRDPGSAVGRSQNPTNLHTHGLLVSPRAAISGVNVWGDDPFVRAFNRANGKIPAFERMMGPVVYNAIDYSYDFPVDHPSGLFWFHPHAHGLAQPQITSGMSGLLTVGHVADEICDNAKCQSAISLIPQRQLLLKDAQIESSGKLLLDQDTGFCAVDDSVGSTSRSHQGACHGGKNSPVSGLNHTGGRWIYSINGQVFPTITVGMPTGQIWRITNSSPNTTYDLNLWLLGEKREMDMQVLWIDGVNVGTKRRYGQSATPCRSGIFGADGVCTRRLHMMPASRAEIWVGYRDAQGVPRQKPAPSQVILRTSGYRTGPTGDNFPAIDLAKVAIANGQVDMQGDGAMSARKPKPNMPGPNAYAVDTSMDATPICRPLPPGHMRRIFFNMLSDSPATFGLGWEEIDETGRTIPGTFQDVEAFNPENTPLCLQLAPGNQPEIERWQLVNLAGEDHNFHMHQVRFNVIDAPSVDGTIAPKFIGLHAQNVDSLPLAHADVACDSVADWRAGKCSTHPATVEIPFTIAGEYVFHCHILEHEDSGMMAKIQVLTNDAKPTARRK